MLVAVFTLVFDPSQGTAQVSFVMTGHLETSVSSPSVAGLSPGADLRAGGWNLGLGMNLDAFAFALRMGAAGVSATAATPAGGDSTAASTANTPVVDQRSLLTVRMIESAGRFVGTRYRWGGDSPNEGFDCSGFVRYVYAQQGIDLPRTARQQARSGRSVPGRFDALQPGDLLFFAQRGPGIDHVAIYAGDGRIVHASRRGYGVRYDDLTGAGGAWYAQRLVTVRRLIEPIEVPPEPEEPALPLGQELDTLAAGQREEMDTLQAGESEEAAPVSTAL